MKLILKLLVFMMTTQTAFSQENQDQTIFQFIVKNIEGEDEQFIKKIKNL